MSPAVRGAAVASFYRVIGEVVEGGRRIYVFETAVGEPEEFTRSCDPQLAPFAKGIAYSLAEIDERCPDDRAPFLS
jgi:hypothetical protein